jgi:hypothetical protein
MTSTLSIAIACYRAMWLDLSCVPDILYPVAAMVDKMNGQELITGTCVQISANHYVPDEFVAGSHMGGLRNDLNDALSKKPTKHGILDVDLHSEWGPMATLRGLPYIETGLSPTAQSDFSKAAIYRMAYSTRTDISWLMPGLLKKVLPERFAVMLDQGTAAEMGKTIGKTPTASIRRSLCNSLFPCRILKTGQALQCASSFET